MIIFLVVVSCTFIYAGGKADMKETSQYMPIVISKISDSEWLKILRYERFEHHKVAWRINITEVSSFGGFYVKGHLLDTHSARVHLIWAPGMPSSVERDKMIPGSVFTVIGFFEGVTADQEAMISVMNCR